jgi:hypothetical protein
MLPVIVLAGVFGFVLTLQGQTGGFKLVLRDGLNGYQGTQDFYTLQMEGGVFNSKTDLDDQTLKVAPLESDTKFVMRFDKIPLSRSSYGMIYRVALQLTLKEAPESDTLMVHNLNERDLWSEREGDYNSLNGAVPWSGADGKLIDAWRTTDAIARVTGSEKVNTTITLEFYPNDASARKALIDSWLDGGNQGFVVCGMSAKNEFYSSDAYNPALRPELIIEYSTH